MKKYTAKLISLCTVLAVCFFVSWMQGPAVYKKITDPITAIKIISHFDMVSISGKKQVLEDTLFIYYKNSYMLCQISYTNLSPDYKKHEFLPTYKSYYYFARHKDSAMGLKFYNLAEVKGTYCAADSFLNSNAFMAGDYSEAAVAKPYNVTSKGDLEIKKYIQFNPKNADNPDTAIYTFSKKQIAIPYTFSALMDSVHQAKLVSILLLFKKRYYSKYKIVAPPRKIYVGFTVMDRISNYAAIDSAFNKIEQLLHP